jgi:AraC-like DNA-binding protein
MMETIFILTVSLLPCLVYLSVGIYVVFKMRGQWDGSDGTTSGIQKDFAILLLVIALCYLSGCSYMAVDVDTALSGVMDRIVMKLYVVSSFMPCVYVRRYVLNDRPWIHFYIPAFFILLLILFTDAMLLSGAQENVSEAILFRGSVFIALVIFCFVTYTYFAHGSALAEEDRTDRAGGLLAQILSASAYNFLLLFYSFGLHVILDYFILISGFAVIHGMLFVTLKRNRPESGISNEGPDCCRRTPNGMVLGSLADSVLRDVEEDTSLSLKERLLNYFENEKPYLSKDLSMQEVAMRLFTNKSYLSKTINVEMNKNFRELVNYFRVREAMRIFSANTDISMSDLRDMCGFNNNASFTSAFKLNTGCTPGEWCRDMKNKLQEERRNSNERQ